MSATEALPRFACPDWWEKIEAGETPMADVPVNADKAAIALAFFNRLRLPDVAGNPPLSEACGDWFRDILVAFLASEDPQTGARIVWEVLAMVPKKSSKSTYVAALALTALYLEASPNSQMLLIGPSQNISARLFGQAQGMIRLDPALAQIFHIQDHLKTITRRQTGTALSVKTFDTGIITGEIPVLTIIDELHELGKKSGAASVMQQIRGGGITMKGGQVMMITTQSDKAPAGIWRSELDKARAIRDGKGGARPIMLPVLYEFPVDLQKDETFWRDRGNWHFVLPNLGLSIDQARLEEDYENNGKVTPEAEQIWVSQHLNIEIGVGLSGGWTAAEDWEGAAIEGGIDLAQLMERCEVAVVGIDGGGLDDLFGIAVIGRDRESKDWLCWTHAWAHRRVLDRRPIIAERLRDFAAQGDLTFFDERDPTADVEGAADIVARLFGAGLLPDDAAIGMDTVQVYAIIEALVARGLDEEQLKYVGQDWRLSPAIWGLERKLQDGTFRHAGQRMMDWVLGNAKVEQRGSAVRMTKEAAGKAKIDPLIAVLNAFILMARNPEGQGRSYLESAGLMVL
ncbi:MAG: terminase large subunit [Sphingomonadales bacterium]|nr:terminase large subunit [Sphingomonadales bacterium]